MDTVKTLSTYLQEVHALEGINVHTVREEPAGFGVHYIQTYDSGDFSSCYTWVARNKLEKFLNETR